MNTHNLCFEQKYEKYQNFLSANDSFLVIKFSIYLNRHVFVLSSLDIHVCIVTVLVACCGSLVTYFFLQGGYNLDTTADCLSMCVSDLLGDPCPSLSSLKPSER